MRLWPLILFTLFTFSLSFGTTPKDSSLVRNQAKDTANFDEDTVYVVYENGIPWNREHFDPNRLYRHETFDPALKAAYTYSLNFVGGSFGTFASQSFMAHLAYEFSPNLHLYADLGIWMPMYSNPKFGIPMAKEDVQQGRAQFTLPDIELVYKPSEKTSFRIMFINERDAIKAYGPRRYYNGHCDSWRNSIFCP